jgi:N-acetylglucosaminyl-diphospho-decaprenol L-rhamnosyltransferase
VHPFGRTGIVIVTRDRREDLLATLGRLSIDHPGAPVVVLDNASQDGTAKAVREWFGHVRVLELPVNLGAAARNLGACMLGTPYVAFNDDDSHWAPDAFARAEARFDARPSLGLLAGRVLVGEEERLDPTCVEMAESPIAAPPGAVGPAVLGFVACGAIVRREAFLAAGGFDARMGIGGEEALLSVDLAAAGWELAYVDDVVAHHHPAARGERPGRRAQEVRNALWARWLRTPARPALAGTAKVLAGAAQDREAARGVAQALQGLPWVLRERRPAPPHVAAALAALG